MSATTRVSTTQNGGQAFLSEQNEIMLNRLIYQDFQRRLGGELSSKQSQRLMKTVRHYMIQANETMPNAAPMTKNAKVLEAVVPDFLSYLNRAQRTSPTPEEDITRMDVGARFNHLQNERQQGKAAPPPPPDFRVPLNEEGPTAISIFEQVRKAREEETLRGEARIASRLQSERSFQQEQEQSEQLDQLIVQDREQRRLASQRESAAELATRLITPDPRRIFMKDILEGNPMGQGTPLESLIGDSGLANTNSTIALPTQIRVRPALPQDTIIREDDIVAYKENEYNLFVYSADRDWINNRTQNRYNFTVNFDPANNRPGFSLAPTAAIKFKNITRIELVKTILPIEGLEIIQTRDASGTTTISYGTSLNTNILSFPYLNVYIQELDNNNFGTDNPLQKAFAVLQYDANWVSDNQSASKGGFLAMIPKFLKCQKVYAPTPLATLTKLTIQIERPDGALVSKTPDTLDISGFKSSYNMTNCPSGNGNVGGTDYADTSGNYIWIQTKTWFSRFEVNQGDRILLGGIVFPPSYSGNQAAKTDFIRFLERPEGHLVVAIANTQKQSASPTIFYKDGPNIVGYANYIIIRSKMKDPTLGFTDPDTFGLLSNSDNNTFLDTLCGAGVSTGRLINLSHQTTLVFRVITRDFDPTTRIRPDNL